MKGVNDWIEFSFVYFPVECIFVSDSFFSPGGNPITEKD
jgi:hypothetical protein